MFNQVPGKNINLKLNIFATGFSLKNFSGHREGSFVNRAENFPPKNEKTFAQRPEIFRQKNEKTIAQRPGKRNLELYKFHFEKFL